MTQPVQTADDFFSGGSKSISWADENRAPLVGKTVRGTIVAVHPSEPQTDIQTKEVIVDKRTGKVKTQVRIELKTDERDPEIEYDDGTRTLYVKGWMKGAIGDAVRKAGAQGAPKIGGTLAVTLTHTVPSDVPGFNPQNRFSAEYTPPSGAGADTFFNEGAAAPSAAPAAAAPEPQRPPSIPEAAWKEMSLEAKKSVAATLSGNDEPPF
jgi:hypothetical protein